MILVYPAIFRNIKGTDEYTVIVPDLPGCVTGGKSLADAIFMGTDAASGWLLGELEEGNQLPIPTPRNEVELKSGDFINMLVLDMEAYAYKYGKKAVRKNLTIPAYMDTFAEKNNLNLSKLLQNAIANQMHIL